MSENSSAMGTNNTTTQTMAASTETHITNQNTAAVAATKKPATIAETSKIYVGPSIPQEGLNRFRIYRNGMPEHFEKLFTVCSAVKKLFVDVDNLSEVLNEIEQTGSAYHTWYVETVKYVKGA